MKTKIFEIEYLFEERYKPGNIEGGKGREKVRVTAKNIHDAIFKACLFARNKHEDQFVNDAGKSYKVALSIYEPIRIELIVESDC